MNRQRGFIFIVMFFFIVVLASQSTAQLPPIPSPEPDPNYQNIFYGAIPTLVHLPPDVGEAAPVLVFVHGISGIARYWWDGNDMYETAYWNGYRTVFISLSPDNTPNRESIETNAVVLQELLPHIAQHFNTDKMYMIGHSKGGVDIQAAMLNPDTANLVKAVFTISSPNQGTELADWVYEHPDWDGPLNLLSPAIESLKTAKMAEFRSLADPILKSYGIPFYTMTGIKFTEHPITEVTGRILRSLVPGITRDTNNDGFVTVARSKLSDEYSADLGPIPFNHFATDSGSVSFSKILGRIKGLEFEFNEFNKIAASGFSKFGGDIHNSWIWSAKWFKGKLYIGTGREINCVSSLIADINTGSKLYPLQFLAGHCPDAYTLSQSLNAEIWCYTPESGEWKRVFKSPSTIPIAFDEHGNPTLYTARDIGFRGMEVFQEADETEALYVGGATSGSVFDPVPFRPEGYPPPRLLRTVDGINWEAVPQEPGTFLGEIGNVLINPETKFRAFRSLKAYKGKLFITMSDFIGSGVIIASSNPAQGNNAWQQVSPPRDEFAVWTLTVFNNYLYATTGPTKQQDPTNPGYGVYKTNAEGDPPYTFTPIVVKGGNQTDPNFRSPNGLSFAEFNGQLYLGTNRPTELIRINPDDSWDLVVGEPRETTQGYKAPISGFSNGFANFFNGHFWRMASYGGHLYLGTWDWSAAVQGISFLYPLDKLFTEQYGFDLYRTDDGVHWTAVTRTGKGIPYNVGVRSLESTPIGLFLGTAGEKGHGGEVYCTTGPSQNRSLLAPKRLKADSESQVGRTTILHWEPSSGAVRYRIYRSILISLIEPVSQQFLTIPAEDGSIMTVTISDLVFPLPSQLISVTTDTTFSEPAPTDFQSIYFVCAEDAQNNVSDPSNIVGAPSKAELEPEPSCSRRSR